MSAPPATVVGRIPVLECLRARKRPARALYYLDSAKGLGEILNAARRLPAHAVDKRELDRRAGGVLHQGVVLEAEPLPLLNLHDWLRAATGPDQVVVVLDEIEDPQNFGAIARSAAACGAHALLFGRERTAPLSTAAAKAAAGALEHIDLVQGGNLAQALQRLRDAGFWSAALDPAGEQTLWQADLRGKVALVIGSEGRGVRRIVLDQCDWRLRIPLQGAITSLNASVSAGIALAECLRQRQPAGPAA